MSARGEPAAKLRVIVMKEHKTPGQGSLDQNPVREPLKNGAAGMAEHHSIRPAVAGQKPSRPSPMMQGDIQTRSKRGRLSREALGKLGRVLETYFDDVRKEGVPDRLEQLLEGYEG